MRSLWPQVRAAIVLFHVLAVVIVNVPAPTGRMLSRNDPNFTAELSPWARLLRTSETELAARLIDVRTHWLRARNLVVWPFVRYLGLVGAQQPWKMFSSANRVPARLRVELRAVTSADESAGWRLVGGLPPGGWHGALFNSERMRSYVNTIARDRKTRPMAALCRYLTRRVLIEHVHAAEAHCSLVIRRTPSWREVGSDTAQAETTLYAHVVGRSR